MKKHRFIRAFAGLMLIASVFLAGMVVQQEREEAKKNSTVKTGNIEQEQANDYVKLLPGTTLTMLSPEYWKSNLSGEVLFSAEEIEDYQKNNPLSVQYFDNYEGRTLRLFMYDMPDSLRRGVVEALIDVTYLDDAMAGVNNPYVNGKHEGREHWASVKENCALDDIPEQIIPKYCICVSRDVAKLFPTDDFVTQDPDEIYCNDLVSAEVMPLTGVVAIHKSKDGNWIFVINGSFCGWVKKDCLAYCEDREQWLSVCKPDEFLVVTGCEIVLDQTAISTHTAGMILPMGTKIKLLKTSEELVNGRMGLNNYLAEVPFRKEDGTIDFEKVLIPVSKDVSVGYLTMTSDAVIEQAFKFLGKVYGWGGSLSSNDCSGLVRQVYECFGFELPRNSAAIAQLYDLGCRDYAAATAQKKLEFISKIPTGSLLYMDGHIMIYLGMVGDEPYVISSCATYIDPGDASGSIQDAYGVFVSNLKLLRKNGRTWLESLKYFQWKDY